MFSKEDYLTPSENLIMEVLIARARLGEMLWTFDSNVKHHLASLEEKGAVMVLNGIVPKTVRAGLSDEAVVALLSFNYSPPFMSGTFGFLGFLGLPEAYAEFMQGRLDNAEARVIASRNRLDVAVGRAVFIRKQDDSTFPAPS